MSEKIDFELTASLALEISDRLKLIAKYFPKNNELLLKHSVAAAIHMALFIKDVYDYKDGEYSEKEDKYVEEFLEECGCKDE